VDPEAENSLFGMAKLSSPGKDPATVDPNWEIEGLAVFEC
jgi:hypothetical protein